LTNGTNTCGSRKEISLLPTQIFTISTKKVRNITFFSAINIKSNLLELRRVIAIQNLAGMTKNLQKASKEFVIHVSQEPDYRVNCA
jgi:hypothetical protein